FGAIVRRRPQGDGALSEIAGACRRTEAELSADELPLPAAGASCLIWLARPVPFRLFQPVHMNPLLGILLCVLSTIGFTLMGAMVRYIGDRVPVGEMVFARNFVVLVPLVLVLAMRGELRKTIRT